MRTEPGKRRGLNTKGGKLRGQLDISQMKNTVLAGGIHRIPGRTRDKQSETETTTNEKKPQWIPVPRPEKVPTQ